MRILPIPAVASMRCGFLVGLPEDVERFDPVLRQLPGARFVLPAGRWPSRHLDSRSWTKRQLRRRGWVALESPTADLDVLVIGASVDREQCRPWLREGGRMVLWRQERAPGRLLSEEIHSWTQRGLRTRLQPKEPLDVVLCPGEGWLEGLIGVEGFAVGDPRLDAALEVGAAARGRSALGLVDSARPLILVALAEPAGAAATHADALARLRSDYDLVLQISDRCQLAGHASMPRAFSGPGLRLARAELPVADLVAAADLILAEISPLAAGALALGKRLLLLSDGPAHGMNGASLPPDPLLSLPSCAETVEDPGRLHRAVAERLRAPARGPEPVSAILQRISGPTDGAAARRLAELLISRYRQIPVALA